MAVNVREFSDKWAYDISKDVISKGEIWNEKAINQSIELILATGFSERLFNPRFGCPLTSYLFESINTISGERLLDDIIAAINLWENRVIVISQMASIRILNDDSSIILTIPYIIKRGNVATKFIKKINF